MDQTAMVYETDEWSKRFRGSAGRPRRAWPTHRAGREPGTFPAGTSISRHVPADSATGLATGDRVMHPCGRCGPTRVSAHHAMKAAVDAVAGEDLGQPAACHPAR